jgi:hypothetical protein
MKAQDFVARLNALGHDVRVLRLRRRIIPCGKDRNFFEMTSRTVIEPIQNPASARYW